MLVKCRALGGSLICRQGVYFRKRTLLFDAALCAIYAERIRIPPNEGCELFCVLACPQCDVLVIPSPNLPFLAGS